MLGIGGTRLSHRQAVDTGRILSQIDPDFVSALTLIVVPGTPLEREIASGTIEIADSFALLEELGTMIAHSDLGNCLFASNHAPNYLSLKVRMPSDRERALRVIEEILHSREPSKLRPEPLRALYGLLLKSLFAFLGSFLINLRLAPGALKTRPSGSNPAEAGLI